MFEIVASIPAAAHYGEMNLTLGMKHGVTGAVIDGGIRDTRHILETNVPVFARYFTPVEAKMRWSYYAWDLPVTSARRADIDRYCKSG